MPHAEDRLGQPIPADTPHAVSVTLPTWKANVGYEEGEKWVVSKMVTGYPRFFINTTIVDFAAVLAARHGHAGEQAMLFPSHNAAARCLDFLRRQADPESAAKCRVLDFVAAPGETHDALDSVLELSAVLFPEDVFKIAKSYWQHTGDGVSSRQAQHCHELYDEGFIFEARTAEELARQRKGPKRYRKGSTEHTAHAEDAATNGAHKDTKDNSDRARFVEERFGRNLNLQLANDAKLAIRRRIAGSLTLDASLDEALQHVSDDSRIRQVPGFSPDNVYLYPGGMNAIFSTHLRVLAATKAQYKSICFGFPYVDTLKVLEKWGPGCLFYGRGSDQDLDDLEQRLKNGEKYSALFCEFPSNPLLHTPNLVRIRALADQYDFAVVVDETVGNYLNVHTLPLADVLVSSLTKIFSGDSNVMGGCAIFNPQGKWFARLRDAAEYEDTYWAEDALVMERNSRDFVARIDRINVNAEAVCDLLAAHPKVKNVYYPKVSPSRKNYDACRAPTGGYGGLLSATFHSTADAAAFYDNLDTEKGPSLGTNFTLASPFVILAHYTELEWAESFGVDRNLIRFSIGLEAAAELRAKVAKALAAIPA